MSELQTGNKTLLRFRAFLAPFAKYPQPSRDRFDYDPPEGQRDVRSLVNCVNRTQWRGFEAGSVRVVGVKASVLAHVESDRSFATSTASIPFDVLIGVRPVGWISREEPRQRLNGWRLEVRDSLESEWKWYGGMHRAEFADFDFGEFAGECDVGLLAP